MNDVYSADVEKVIGVQFSLMDPRDIERRSVVEITKPRIYDGGGIPCPGGLADRKMGVLESGITCSTDDLDKQECPGYFGHIELAMPVFYVQFMPWIRGVLESVCYRCGALRVHRELRKKQLAEIAAIKKNATRYTRLTKLIKEDKTGSAFCPLCNAKQPDKYIYEKEDLQFIAEWVRSGTEGQEAGAAATTGKKQRITSRVLMTPEYVQMLFKRLPDEDCVLLGFNPTYSRPEWMICTVLPVAPPCVRPSVKKEGQQPRSEDDLTHKYIDIIKCNRMLKQKLHVLAQQQQQPQGTSATGTTDATDADDQTQIHSRMVESWRYILQYHVATLIDNECGVNQAQQRSGRPLKAIRQRLKSKEGRIRGNLMGKRVDFSARTVITPDPLLNLDELGVPLDMCINMTIPERVNPFNLHRLRKMVANGTDNYPGARIVEKANGVRLSLKFFTRANHRHLLEEKAQALQVGDVVHRHLLAGDPVLFNRQPSLHKMSMMCHRVKPMDIGKTFRLCVDATTPYNADFDGDEMNMHVPQSMEAATELRSLAAVHRQLIGPALAEPIISPVQDTMLGAYLMSKAGNQKVFDRRHFMNAMMWTSRSWSDLHEQDKLPSSESVSGYDAYTAILPKGLNVHMKGKARVDDGRFVEGVLNKGVFKAQSEGLIHVAFQDCGPTAARNLIDDVRGMVTSYMYQRGFSVGLSDLVVDPSVQKQVQEVVVDVHKAVQKDMHDLYTGKLENNTRLTKAALVEELTREKGTNIFNTAAKLILKTDTCRFKDMITSKSKGSETNVGQMMGCLGQQMIEGARASYSFQDRTLPHFCKYDDSLEARGFVNNSYMNGLTPHEFFFHAMGGRVGLIDTAVKTAQTGYIQRKLVKSMEDIRCEHDDTVRVASGRIVNLLFADDGMDSAKLEKQSVPFACQEGTIVRDYLGALGSKGSKGATKEDIHAFVQRLYAPSTPADVALLRHQGLPVKDSDIREPDVLSGLPAVTYYRNIVCGGSYTVFGHLEKSCTHRTAMYPVHLGRVLKQVLGGAKPASTASKSPLSFTRTMEAIDDLVHTLQFGKDPDHPAISINPAIQMFRVLLYGTLLRVETRRQLANVPNGLTRCLNEVQRRFLDAKVHPGEMVGVVAAQSIGEPATQMTLNTFHLAGVGSKSKVTQGVPRLKEILTLTKNPKTAQLRMFLHPDCRTEEDAISLKNMLELTTLRHVTRGTSIYYDPAVDRFGTTLEEDAQVLQYLDALQSELFQDLANSEADGGNSGNGENGENGEENDSHTDSSPTSPTSPNHWVVRIDIDHEEMFTRDLRMEDIYLAMKSLHGDDIDIEYSDDNSDNLLIRVRISSSPDQTDQMDDYYLLKMLESNLLDNVVLRGVPLIRNVHVAEETTGSHFILKDGVYTHTDTQEHILYAEGTKSGTSLQDILTHPAIDATRTLSDHITEVYEVLGIEAVRELILRELAKVIDASGGTPPSRRHMMLLADTMTAQGSTLISIDRNGIKRSDIGPLAKCSFEESDKQLYQAAIFGESDNVDGVSANIMLGQVPPCGTGMVRVRFDEEGFLEMQRTFEAHSQEWHQSTSTVSTSSTSSTSYAKTWTDHVLQWERDMEGMHRVQMEMQGIEDSGELPEITDNDMVWDGDGIGQEEYKDDGGSSGHSSEDDEMDEYEMMACDTRVMFGDGVGLDD